MTAPATQAAWLDRSTPPKIFTLVALSAVGALNMNVFLPSLPSMAEYFHADYAVVQLAVSAYLATTAVLQLLIGPLSDRYGRRVVTLAALAMFLVAVLGCILAPTIELFLAFRMLSASVVAGFALSRAVVRDMVGPAEAASMIGYVTMGMAVAPMVGPMIGGVLDEIFGWRAPFALLFGLGAGVLWLAWRDMGETNLHRSAGFGEQFRAYPDLVRSRRFWGYALTAAFASGAFFAFLGGAPYVATQVLGMSPSAVGFWFGSLALGYAFGNFLSGKFSARIGLNRMMLFGTFIATGGVALSLFLTLSVADPTPLRFFAPLAFVGVGNGLTMPNASAGTVSVRPRLAGSAAGLGGALMIGGGALLSTISGAMLGPGTGGYPLLLVMLASSAAAIGAVAYVMWVEAVRGPLPGG